MNTSIYFSLTQFGTIQPKRGQMFPKFLAKKIAIFAKNVGVRSVVRVGLSKHLIAVRIQTVEERLGMSVEVWQFEHSFDDRRQS